MVAIPPCIAGCCSETKSDCEVEYDAATEHPGNWLDCHCRRLGERRGVVMQTKVGDVVKIEVNAVV